MFRVHQISILALLAALIELNLGCSSIQHQNDIVTTSLNGYQVGKTTLADLKKDTGMVLIATQAPKSYLNPLPSFLVKLQDPTTYILPAGSPWKIYYTRQSLVSLNGKFMRTWAFVIGDTNRPICFLEFDFTRMLTNISLIHNFNPPPPRFSVEWVGIGSAPNFLPQKAEADFHGSPSPLSIEMVAQTLQSYQTGKTTIQDFVRDAKLINLYDPELNAITINSNAAPVNLARMVRSSYRVPSGGPWEIYETGKSSSQMFGVFPLRWRFVVGDVNKPICILSFDERGILREKKPCL